MNAYRFRTDRKGRLILQVTDTTANMDFDRYTYWRDAKVLDISQEMAFDFVMGKRK